MPDADAAMWSCRVRLAFALVNCAAALACGESREQAGAGGTTRRGDTTVVISSGDGVWGPLHDAIEELRVPGTHKETTFGQVSSLLATSNGGVLVYDTKGAEGKILRQFDSTGAFVRNIGREGRGPGEYSGDQLTIVESNGGIVVRDMMHAIISYDAVGRYINGFAIGFNAGALDLAAATDGSLYTAASRATGFPKPGERRMSIMYHYDPAGRLLDSVIGKPWLAPGDPAKAHSQFDPHELRRALSDGRNVIVRTDKLGFLIVDPSGKQSPLIVERPVPPIPYLDEERQELRAGQRAQRVVNVDGERIANPGAEVEPTKFKLPLMTMYTDVSGRVWLMKSGPTRKVATHCTTFVDNNCISTGSYGQQVTYLAFQPDGTFLGEVRFPFGAHPTFAGDHAWAIVRDNDDVPVLVRYRLHN